MTTHRVKVGVAVITGGDVRAARLTMASLIAQGEQVHHVVVAAVPNLAGRAGVDIGDYTGRAFHFDVLPYALGSPREAALHALRGYDVALILDEGVLLKSGFIESECAAFMSCAGLAARMISSESAADINTLPRAAHTLPADQLLQRFAQRRGKLAPLYFSPTILMISPKQCPQDRFERFSNRSGWAASRFFIDSLSGCKATDHIASDRFGYCGAEPDRRAGYEQGRLCCQELYMMASAFPAYRAMAEADIRRLIIAQVISLAIGRPRRTALSFLRGLTDEIRIERTKRRRLTADIKNLG